MRAGPHDLVLSSGPRAAADMSTRATRRLLLAAAALAVVGASIASYLTVVHYAHQPIACSSIGDCELVNSSKYADLAGVPVAVLGALSYLSMLVMVIVAGMRRSSGFILAAWAIAFASFGFSVYLTYIELRVLDAICVYCVASASVITALFATLSAVLWLVQDELFG